MKRDKKKAEEKQCTAVKQEKRASHKQKAEGKKPESQTNAQQNR